MYICIVSWSFFRVFEKNSNCFQRMLTTKVSIQEMQKAPGSMVDECRVSENVVVPNRVHTE
jgi:hypothetical protein